MQALIDLFINSGVLSKYDVETYTKLHIDLDNTQMMLYDTEKNELCMYSYICGKFDDLDDLDDLNDIIEIEFEERAKILYSKYIIYKFNDYERYDACGSKKLKSNTHDINSIKMLIIKHYEYMSETTNFENIYAIQYKNNSSYHPFKICMFSSLSKKQKKNVRFDIPFLACTEEIQVFTIASTGSYI